MTMDEASKIKTRFLVLSDTHGLDLSEHFSNQHTDVVLHCGDLTTESKLDEFRASLHMLESINAPLKLVIAGNHDFTLDTLTFQEKVTRAGLSEGADHDLVNTVYGDYGDAKRLSLKEHTKGIILLDEGTHTFTLQNGASLTLYASPYTPSLGDWGFQYHSDQGHRFDIRDVDLVMTHGPPRGIMDVTESGTRAGYLLLSRARPLMHCFGHIHEGWGAKIVAWRGKIGETPSHLADTDNGQSVVIEKLSGVCPGAKRTRQTSHCSGDPVPLQRSAQTLFINAAMEGIPLTILYTHHGLLI